MKFLSFIFLSLLISSFFLKPIHANDSLLQNQSISDGQTLISSGQTFELGFFSPTGSSSRFMGIWYKKTPELVVWIANREHPLIDSRGVLKFIKDGNLVLLNGRNDVSWSSNSSGPVQDLVVQLLETGNLVVKRKDGGDFIWQSFDFPTNTLLAGMKMGWSLITGQTKFLTSWKNESDPSFGEYTYTMEHIGLPQTVLRKGSAKTFRSGSWNGVRFSGLDTLSNPVFNPFFAYDDNEGYYSFEAINGSVESIDRLNESGFIERLVLDQGSWSVMTKFPNDLCDNYGTCGPNGFCRTSSSPVCQCLEGFVPASQREWNILNRTAGCVRRTPLNCNGDGFLRLRNVKIPDLLKFQLNKSMSLQECQKECLKDCSCSSYASSDIRKGGSGCLMWFGDLIDLREYIEEHSEQDIYIRLPASELAALQTKKRKRAALAIVATFVSGGALGLCILAWCIFKRREKRNGLENGDEDIDLPVFELNTITIATKSFSLSNLIGEGGFGLVYKGELSTGQEIAVKRLSKNSAQGLHEFKNEVRLISKLQHRNLVRLLGCCLDGEERMLIYEYMSNRSLDYFIFDNQRKNLLAWPKRFEIAIAISKGLLYLHEDSRLRIIHRDLKASNILLDGEMNPKISDFGIARTFGGDQIEGKTKRVIGTYGYMSPEYAFHGSYSVKSDVFSLGVLLLELVSGRKNRILDPSDQHLSLLGHAWLLWNEQMALELMDGCLRSSFNETQVIRCIQVGLLCVQKLPIDRPTMASVVFMLSDESGTLPEPKHPGFYVDSSTFEVGKANEEQGFTGTAATITTLQPR